MLFSMFLASLIEFGNSLVNYQVFGILYITLFSGIILLVLKLVGVVLFRKKYNRLLPGRKLRLLDIFGDLYAFRPTDHERNGFSLNVFILQILSAFYQLFPNKQLLCYWFSYLPFILINKAEAAEALISGTEYMRKGWSYNWMHSWFGTGLLTSHASKWKSRRKLLRQSFHVEILNDFIPVINKQSRGLVKCLQEEINKDSTDIVMPVTLCVFDIICETAFGVDLGIQENKDCQYVKSAARAAEIIMRRAVNCFHWLDFTFNFTALGKEQAHHIKFLRDFTLSIIREKKRKLLSVAGGGGVSKGRMALMDLLLEHHVNKKDLTEEDVREEIDTFAFEGHDTLYVAISWALYLVGLHKDVQENIHEELDFIFGNDTERHVTAEDLKDMKYLNCVIKESQRLYPAVPIIARQIEKETSICGYSIPQGATCVLDIQNLHRDERWFPNPEKFDPDRFLPENCTNRHPYAYIPFSAGPRNCIGQKQAEMEMKIIIATVLRNYTLESLDQRDKLPTASELILKSVLPIRVKINRRKKCFPDRSNLLEK